MTTRNLIAESRARFVQETSEHRLEVLHDDGLYRHLRFQRPDTITYYFDLVTWPGHLAITGDCGDFVFSRVRDMFEFFEGGLADERYGINPGYWSEKLRAPAPDAAERYSYDALAARLGEWLEQQVEEHPEQEAPLRAAVAELLADERAHDAHGAHDLLYGFECEGIRIYEAWDWNLREYDWRFLWCCWAIVWGINRYAATKA